MDCVFAVLVPVVCGSLPDIYVEKLLGFVAACLEKSGHLQFYMTWAQSLLLLHGQKLKNRSAPSLFYCVMKHSLPSQWNCQCNLLCLRGVQVGSHTAHAPGAAEEHPETL